MDNRFHQTQRVDFSETFSLMTKVSTIRVILPIAMGYNWSIHYVDINNAFINGTLYKFVYMPQPKRFENPTKAT